MPKFCDNCGHQIIINGIQPQNTLNNEKIYENAMKGVRKNKIMTCINSYMASFIVIFIIFAILAITVTIIVLNFSPSK